MIFLKILILIGLTLELASAIKFNCTYQVRESKVNGYLYSCDAIVFNLDNKFLTEVKGPLPFNRKFSDVQHVFIHKCDDLTYVPKGMKNFFPNLISMHIYKCGIEKLNSDDLTEYKDFKLFGIKENEISEIPSDFFANTPNMSEIYFTDNKITKVGKKITEHLPNLSTLR